MVLLIIPLGKKNQINEVLNIVFKSFVAKSKVGGK